MKNTTLRHCGLLPHNHTGAPANPFWVLGVMLVMIDPVTCPAQTSDSTAANGYAITVDSITMDSIAVDCTALAADSIAADTSISIMALTAPIEIGKHKEKHRPVSLYAQPYSFTGNSYDWKRLWNNTAVLTTAFVGTLVVLECLPEDATSWNRAEIRNVPMFKRWDQHVIKQGPAWDHDKAYFNYLLHPYAGAVYFMTARSCGFNFWRSFLYSSIISNVGWEFGIEAFMERPSIQDMIVTPVIGSCIGEGFYRLKRILVENDYCVLGSHFLGGLIAWLIDPVNELTGLWLGNPARQTAHELAHKRAGCELTLVPTISSSFKGFTFVGTF